MHSRFVFSLLVVLAALAPVLGGAAVPSWAPTSSYPLDKTNVVIGFDTTTLTTALVPGDTVKVIFNDNGGSQCLNNYQTQGSDLRVVSSVATCDFVRAATFTLGAGVVNDCFVKLTVGPSGCTTMGEATLFNWVNPMVNMLASDLSYDAGTPTAFNIVGALSLLLSPTPGTPTASATAFGVYIGAETTLTLGGSFRAEAMPYIKAVASTSSCETVKGTADAIAGTALRLTYVNEAVATVRMTYAGTAVPSNLCYSLSQGGVYTDSNVNLKGKSLALSDGAAALDNDSFGVNEVDSTLTATFAAAVLPSSSTASAGFPYPWIKILPTQTANGTPVAVECTTTNGLGDAVPGSGRQFTTYGSGSTATLSDFTITGYGVQNDGTTLLSGKADYKLCWAPTETSVYTLLSNANNAITIRPFVQVPIASSGSTIGGTGYHKFVLINGGGFHPTAGTNDATVACTGTDPTTPIVNWVNAAGSRLQVTFAAPGICNANSPITAIITNGVASGAARNVNVENTANALSTTADVYFQVAMPAVGMPVGQTVSLVLHQSGSSKAFTFNAAQKVYLAASCTATPTPIAEASAFLDYPAGTAATSILALTGGLTIPTRPTIAFTMYVWTWTATSPRAWRLQ